MSKTQNHHTQNNLGPACCFLPAPLLCNIVTHLISGLRTIPAYDLALSSTVAVLQSRARFALALPKQRPEPKPQTTDHPSGINTMGPSELRSELQLLLARCDAVAMLLSTRVRTHARARVCCVCARMWRRSSLQVRLTLSGQSCHSPQIRPNAGLQ